jgi:oxygen-independent coproporphyrinogen III oxidase
MNGKEDLRIYVHVPFCTRKCPYCHFYSLSERKEQKELYFHALLQEIELWKDTLQKHTIITLYFGGGTPSLLPAEWLSEIIQKISPIRDAEITIEVNPENATRELFSQFRAIGISRVSIGVQSFHDNELEALSRPHTSRKAKDAVFMAHKAGFSNISIDLMYEIPHQTLSTFQESLKAATELPITHISLYNLTMEENTPFYRRKDELKKSIVSQEVGSHMYQAAQEILSSSSFKQYEISAFCRNNKRSLHNIGYWQGGPFLGLGPSAFSYFSNSRFSNVSSIQQYATLLSKKIIPASSFDELDTTSRKKELLAIGLRVLDGVRIDDLPHDLETHKALSKLIDDGLLEKNDERIHLSSKGILFYDEVASRLI